MLALLLALALNTPYDPVFVVHEFQIGLFKLLLTYRSLHYGNNAILLASVGDRVRRGITSPSLRSS